MKTQQLQARVHGAGPTGALAALALAQAGWRVQLLDPLGAEALRQRSRAYALTHSSRELLEGLDLWQPLAAHLAPFRRLELCDRGLHRQVSFSMADLGGADRGAAGRRGADRGTQGTTADAAVGWVLQHGPLMALLLERLKADPAITLLLGEPPTLADPGSQRPAIQQPTEQTPTNRRPEDQNPVDLVVAADGSASPTRRAAGLGWCSRSYRQGCLTVQVRLRGSDPDQAWELFRPEGPFAVLPLGGDAWQLVWSAPLQRLRQLEALDPVAFLDQLAGVLPEQLQAEALLDQPRAWPVALELAWPLASRQLVLVGEAAHRCHPVGGQGLNLCWRDVALLQRLAARAATGRLRTAALPRAYGWGRVPDLVAILLATDALVRLFSNRSPLLLPLRRLALAALARWAWLRRLSLAAMTYGPCPQRRS